MSEMQSPKRVKKTSGAMASLRNVCAVKGVGEDDEDTQPRRSTRQRKTTKKE